MDITISAEDVKTTRRLDNAVGDNGYEHVCSCGTRFTSRHFGIDDCLFYLHSRIAKLEAILNVERED